MVSESSSMKCQYDCNTQSVQSSDLYKVLQSIIYLFTNNYFYINIYL